MNKCISEVHDFYPCYVVGPHRHDLSRGTFIGSTIPLDRVDWPKNYVEDPECEGLGTYYCPECMDGFPK